MIHILIFEFSELEKKDTNKEKKDVEIKKSSENIVIRIQFRKPKETFDLLDFFTRLSHTLRQNCQIQQKRRRPSWPFGPHFHSSTSSVFYGVVDFKT